MKIIFSIFCFYQVLFCFAQKKLIDQHFNKVDSLYREDQFYIGLGINFLINRPQDMRQSGFSGGFHAGYIRDMPLNKRRNFAIGLGLGLSVNTYTQNLLIGENEAGQSTFEVIDNNTNYSENRFSTNVVEIPFHFRWRTSGIGDDSSFWRIYAGINFGYMYYFKSTYRQNDFNVEQTKFNELNRMRYNFYFAFGKSKINFFFRYSLNTLFNAELQNNQLPVGINEIKAGLVFYLL